MTVTNASAPIKARLYSGPTTPLQQYRRDKIIEATRKLLADGEFHPRAEKIAGAAGVAMRTFYNHFDSAAHAWQEALDEATSTAILSRIMPNGPWPCANDCRRVVRAAVFGRLSA